MDKDWNLIKVSDVAKILGIAPQTIHTWVWKDKCPFPVYRIGDKCIRFKRTEIEAYLEQIRKI